MDFKEVLRKFQAEKPANFAQMVERFPSAGTLHRFDIRHLNRIAGIKTFGNPEGEQQSKDLCQQVENWINSGCPDLGEPEFQGNWDGLLDFLLADGWQKIEVENTSHHGGSHLSTRWTSTTTTVTLQKDGGVVSRGARLVSAPPLRISPLSGVHGTRIKDDDLQKIGDFLGVQVTEDDLSSWAKTLGQQTTSTAPQGTIGDAFADATLRADRI